MSTISQTSERGISPAASPTTPAAVEAHILAALQALAAPPPGRARSQEASTTTPTTAGPLEARMSPPTSRATSPVPVAAAMPAPASRATSPAPAAPASRTSSPVPVAAAGPAEPAAPIKSIRLAATVHSIHDFVIAVEQEVGTLERGDVIALDYHGTLNRIIETPGGIAYIQALQDRGVYVFICTGEGDPQKIEEELGERSLTLRAITSPQGSNKGVTIASHITANGFRPTRVALLDDTIITLSLATRHPFDSCRFVGVHYNHPPAARAARAPDSGLPQPASASTLPGASPALTTVTSPDPTVALVAPADASVGIPARRVRTDKTCGSIFKDLFFSCLGKKS